MLTFDLAHWRRLRARPALAGFSAALALVACGGRSARHDVPSYDAPPSEDLPDPTDAQALCSRDEIGVEVTVGGSRRDLALSRGGQAVFQAGCFSVFFDGYDALLHVTGPGPFDQTGELDTVSGWLLLAGENGERARWLCSDGLAISVQVAAAGAWMQPHALVAGESLRDLGSCPGTPVSGTIRWHWQGGGVASSTVEGLRFTEPTNAVVLGRPVSAAAEQTASCGIVYLRWDEDQPGGFVLTSPSDLEPASLYCIGKITELDNSELELEQISRLGGCAEGCSVTGSVAACY